MGLTMALGFGNVVIIHAGLWTLSAFLGADADTAGTRCTKLIFVCVLYVCGWVCGYVCTSSILKEDVVAAADDERQYVQGNIAQFLQYHIYSSTSAHVIYDS